MIPRDTYIQLADYTRLPAGSDTEPSFMYLHDGFDHGSYKQRVAGFKVYSSTGAAGPPAAAGTLLNGLNGQDMRILAVGDVIYTRSLANSRSPSGGRTNLFLSRSVTAVDAAKATMHASADISAAADLFYRKLAASFAAADAGWIGAQDATDIGLQVFVHSGGPVLVYKQISAQPNAPDDVAQGDRPVELASVAVAAAAGEFYRIEGPVGRVRFGFKGPTPSIITAAVILK